MSKVQETKYLDDWVLGLSFYMGYALLGILDVLEV